MTSDEIMKVIEGAKTVTKKNVKTELTREEITELLNAYKSMDEICKDFQRDV